MIRLVLLCLPLAGALASAQTVGVRPEQTIARSAPDLRRDLEPLRLTIDQRLLLAQAVARAKWNVQAPIDDLPREAQVIQAAVKQGAALGLADAWVEAVFHAQIEASKIVQRELYAKWRTQQAGKFDDAPDLAKTVRPELDRITAQLLRSLADNQAVLQADARKAEVARALRPLEATALSPSAVEQALAPFVALH
ncbi:MULTISPECIES: gamma subclass chorismate mutase AroQ [unclassified Duganella]|uniref:gamma subclass chorismate mutase AroQ n=1 Tax=unclassified Duganella TaxID=2636909 RepID=UPI001E2A0B6E|nr:MULTISPECIES: gamma subclass chorismate mutase AroQ [unclassified Duganella]